MPDSHVIRGESSFPFFASTRQFELGLTGRRGIWDASVDRFQLTSVVSRRRRDVGSRLTAAVTTQRVSFPSFLLRPSSRR